jgi:hypothetical protein
MSYNVGPMCVYNAVKEAYEAKDMALTWEDIVLYTDNEKCGRGITYTKQILERFYDFPPADSK